MFRRRPQPDAPSVTLFIAEEAVEVPADWTVAAAVLSQGILPTRLTAVSGAPRAPYCMMGLCFECLMEIDGVPNSQACLTPVRDGMRVKRQAGVRSLGVRSLGE